MSNEIQKRARIQRNATIAVIIIAVVAVVLVDGYKKHALQASTNLPLVAHSGDGTGSTPPPTNGGTNSGSSPSSYKDGTYSASSSYSVPHSQESIKVSLTLQKGVVTAVSVANSEGDPTSAQFQEDFASEYKNYVVGQSLSNLDLGVVAGASDTTYGFDEAVAQIQSQASQS